MQHESFIIKMPGFFLFLTEKKIKMKIFEDFFLSVKILRCIISCLINVKMPTFFGILTFVDRINIM